ncbi:coenzyme F420-0:L-glutamate ligase/coenzyme F420-1:gamma-L-glutamate ligase [Micromonospora pisi]|uniref:Coenzyme F420-0:L-glutamate ligase/coenzyme F420-1:gamma-L-glutamate ligase n=1 Tax=Micromonospora pisi TaxID=589240 RepID=A0A495JQJ2_9ACTN|nr:coenzyme F420-0:L-glutamate ligase [Micromonospora pisi]RKR90319.1 coenzyme F420-0:L-glutamate ligase/coenzyme F420-1:gamma-L-glutamate ligase [Micromonospora pisi]
MKLEIMPVLGIGDVTEGDDLAALIATAAPWLRDGDVLVVTSKIVSKAEGRLVDVPPTEGPERDAAREEVLAAETARPVARRGPTRIVQTHHGFVMASAGIDASNVDAARLVLLPKDPDASARGLRAALRERHGADVAVIVSDTMGRPWRNGLTDVALGVAGMDAIRDHRGEVDPYGNQLSITQMAVVDELAGAGELVKGKCDQVPVAVVRGYLNAVGPDDGPGATTLVRDAEMDLFSLGTAEARASGLRAAATLPESTPAATQDPASVADPVVVARAIAAVADVVAPGTVFSPVTDQGVRAELTARVPDWPTHATTMILCAPPEASGSAATLIRFGADLHRLRAALAAEGLPSSITSAPTDGATAALAL